MWNRRRMMKFRGKSNWTREDEEEIKSSTNQESIAISDIRNYDQANEQTYGMQETYERRIEMKRWNLKNRSQ